MYKTPLFLLFIILSSITYGQISRDVFPLTREFKRGGFYISPQLTTSIGSNNEGDYSIVDTTYSYTVDGKGKLAYGIEVGWFHSFKNPFLIHYLEAGVAYRLFKGEATHEGTLTNPLGTANFLSENSFNNQYIVASLRAVNAKQLGKWTYLSTALGVNFNYELGNEYERSAAYPLSNEEFLNPNSLQVHLQLGIGFRVSRQLVIMPTIESPLLTAYPTDDLNPAFPFFSTNYQPIIIGLKFMFLREDPENCNAPTYNGIQH